MKRSECRIKNPRLGQVGGQAVIEGVMMKHKSEYALAVRMPDGSVNVKKNKMVSVRQKHKILNIPILRGIVNFVEMMILSFRTLTASTEALGIEDMEETKFDKWLNDHFGSKLMDAVMVFSTVLGVVIALGLFVFLPSFLTKLLDGFVGGVLGWWRTLIEGGIKILLFILYLSLTSLMGDIRRTYEYHGAEHKTVFAYEAGVELTPENCRRFKRFHPRCGTSFIFVMLIIGILVASVLPWTSTGLRTLLKLLVMPVIIGVGFEFIMFAGKHCDNIFVRILSAPGLWMQRITTREPDDSQLEIAIIALKSAMPEEFPDFVPPAKEETDNKENSEAAKADESEKSPASSENTVSESPDAKISVSEPEAPGNPPETALHTASETASESAPEAGSAPFVRPRAVRSARADRDKGENGLDGSAGNSDPASK